ncbi:MAG: hypothetical protein NT166_16895 [Candidatus Aminicenantes bacterium]|nr:hypothetical protein [Candidatus Aminicenantes bacterium]
MNIKVKTTLILIGTLIIGIVLGAMLNRALMHMRIKGFLSIRTHKGFVERLEEIIQPSTPQKKEVTAILDKYALQFGAMHEEFKGRVASLLDSFKTDLTPVLTPDQMKVMEEKFFKTGPFHDTHKSRDKRHD